jgi:Holliday junction resolvase
MPNKNYVKGANFEREVKKFYESLGYLVFRTAGSHSPADLIAFPPLKDMKEWQPILIQCKATQKLMITETELNNLKNSALTYGLRAKLIVNIRDVTGRYKEAWVVEK